MTGTAAAAMMAACGSFHGDPTALRPATSISSSGVDPSVLDDTGGYIEQDSSVSPFDEGHPAIANLDRDLRDALQRATDDASVDGVHLMVNSGWRSTEYQKSLLDDAVRTYGSLDEARRWVDTPERSTHVTGHAVDVGPTDASSWLSQHGAVYGLCQTYSNEMWHFELAVTPGMDCPAAAADPTAR
ncbi:MAG: M15 family metallopeptidase [Rhodococcus sp. (in: high G+C Gram-positive bacteria)]|uniref:M15 family metallopeptidase n=1 Tax=Rhodococcus sp. TaxID=1831 RepID=UPI003BB50316